MSKRDLPKPKDLLTPPPVALPAENGDLRLEFLMQNDWANLQAQAERNIWTPELAYWDFLVENAEEALLEIETDPPVYGAGQIFPQGGDRKVLVKSIARCFWKYFWRETLGVKVQNALHTIEQVVGHAIVNPKHENPGRGRINYEHWRAIVSIVRRTAGLDARPGKAYSTSKAQQAVDHRRQLEADLNRVFHPRTRGRGAARLPQGDVSGAPDAGIQQDDTHRERPLRAKQQAEVSPYLRHGYGYRISTSHAAEYIARLLIGFGIQSTPETVRKDLNRR